MRENKYQGQRRRSGKDPFQRKVIMAVSVAAVLLIMIVVGLVKVVLDEKKTGDTQQGISQTEGNEVPGQQNQAGMNISGDSQSTSENSETAEQTNAGVATETPAPTATAVPTATPVPTATATPTPTPTPVPAPKVIIDPGHGGEDLGSVKSGLYEKNVNLEIALFLKEILIEKGYDVFMIRETDADVDNRTRPDTAVEQKGDVYVSIHQNSLETDSDGTRGSEVWYSDLRDDDSDVLAQYVVDELTAVTGAKNRGIKLSNGLIVLKYNGIPACLVECGFMSSETERAMLFTPEYQEKIAQGIANGIMKFLPLE